MNRSIIRSVKTAVLGIAVSACCLVGSSMAHAAPVPGAKIYSTGGDVFVQIKPSSSSFNNFIGLVDPALIFIGIDNQPNAPKFKLGTFDDCDELIFAILSPQGLFKNGPGSRNPDGLIHAWVDFTSPNVATIGWEDLYNGGDNDFNDAVLEVSGAIAANKDACCVPEPASMSLLGMGLVSSFLARRRRQRSA